MENNLGVTPEERAHKEKILDRGVSVHRNIIIMSTPQEVYEYWRNLENHMRFVEPLESIKVLSPTLSHWTWKALKGQKKFEWESEIIQDEPGSMISWRTIGPSDIEHTGIVRFREIPFQRGVLVDVEMVYAPPGGKITDALEKVFGESPAQSLEKDLRKLRDLIETGEIPTIDGQPRGGRGLH